MKTLPRSGNQFLLRPSLRGGLLLAIGLAFSLGAAGLIQDRPSFNVQGSVIVWAADSSGQTPIVSDFIIDTGNGTNAASSGDIDLISTDVHTVVTGTLTPTQDSVSSATGGMPFLITNTSSGTVNTDTNNDGVVSAADSITEFGLQDISDARVDATRQYSSFYVASNVPFAIDAEVLPPASALDRTLLLITRLQLSVVTSGNNGIAFGANAQAPHSGGGQSGFAPRRRLWDYRNARNVFTGDQRTAASPGSIIDQSVRFDAEYAIAAANLSGYDLSLGTFDFEVAVVYTVYVP